MPEPWWRKEKRTRCLRCNGKGVNTAKETCRPCLGSGRAGAMPPDSGWRPPRGFVWNGTVYQKETE